MARVRQEFRIFPFLFKKKNLIVAPFNLLYKKNSVLPRLAKSILSLARTGDYYFYPFTTTDLNISNGDFPTVKSMGVSKKANLLQEHTFWQELTKQVGYLTVN